MTRETDVLMGLFSSELQRLKPKADFYSADLPSPAGQTWESPTSQSLANFLKQHPLPKDDIDLDLWGAAYECAWGIPVPDEILQKKDVLRTKKRTGMETNGMEDIWATLMTIDTDMF